MEWWREEQRKEGGIRHESRGWLRSTEVELEAWSREADAGPWQLLAKDRKGWAHARRKWLRWCNDRLGGPRMPKRREDTGTWMHVLAGIALWHDENDQQLIESEVEEYEGQEEAQT